MNPRTARLTAGILAVLITRSASTADQTTADERWSAVTNGVQTRLVLDKTTFERGEQMRAKVLVRNVTDKPIRYDGRGGRFSLVYVDGNEEKLVPERSVFGQIILGSHSVDWNKRPEPKRVYDFPILEPGKAVEVQAYPLYDISQILVSGKYRLEWTGTSVGAAEEFGMEYWTVFIAGKWDKWYDELQEKAKKIAVGLPRPAAVEFVVTEPSVAAPGGAALGRIQRVMPLGWRIQGIYLPSERIDGAGHARDAVPKSTMVVRLVHRPKPDLKCRNAAYMRVYIAPRRVSPDAERERKLLFLGRCPLGEAYLYGDSGGRWSHVSYDIASALSVTDPHPKKPDGPDWGRVVSRILWRFEKRSHFKHSHYGMRLLLDTAELTPPPGQLARIHYRHNAREDEGKKGALVREDAGYPYYYVNFKITPTRQAKEERQPQIFVDRRLDGQGLWRYTALGVDIQFDVQSDDEQSVKVLNSAVEAEVNAVVAAR